MQVFCRENCLAKLRVIKGPDAGKVFDLGPGSNLIGRDAKCVVRLQDTEISRNHAEVVGGSEGFRLRDLESFNGSFVNCKKIRDMVLHPGDQLQVGQTVMLLIGDADERRDIHSAIFKNDALQEGSPQDKEPLFQSFSLMDKVPESEGSVILSRPQGVSGDWLRSALSRLGVIYEAITATSQILELSPMLERILGLLLETLQADHGSVYLNPDFMIAESSVAPEDLQEHESLRLAVRSHRGAVPPRFAVSKTILDYVLREKMGVIVTDALKDSRFNAVQSIVRSGVREIICVPMRGRHSTVGVIYLDRLYQEPVNLSRSEGGGPEVFVKDHLVLSIAVAHQAALAVEETHHYQARLQAERLAAVGETVAYLSHHIKNILQGLRSGGDILRLGINGSDQALLASAARLIDKNHARLFDLVKDMLSFSKERVPNYESIDLVRLLKDIAELVAPLAEAKGGKLTMEAYCEAIEVFMDSEGIHRVVLNLLNNAIDATLEKDYPLIQLRLLPADSEGWVRIQVSDNGEGIPEGQIEGMFLPFKSSKGNAGTGLGLAVAQKIVREHRGELTVSSQVGVGTTFTISLPINSPKGKESISAEDSRPEMF